MRRIRLRRPSPAMAVACLALMLALGGTSYAAVKLPKNSVGSTQIKRNAVTGAKIKTGSVAASDLAESIRPALGYVNVTDAGVAQGDSKGMDGVSIAQPQPGVYCFSGLESAPGTVNATIDVNGSALGATIQAGSGTLDLCPEATSQVEVQTYNASGARASQPFYLTFQS